MFGRIKQLSLLLCLALFIGCGLSKEREEPKVFPLTLSGNYKSFLESVQPILERRCAVCHSCNDAPCQLDSTSYEGVDRGASHVEVYADRLFSIEPSRLEIDAKSTREWRDRGFFPVIKHQRPGHSDNLEKSILYQLVAARLAVPDLKMNYDSFSSRSCPNLEDALPQLETSVVGIFRDHPNAVIGMPYGFPPLSPKEFAIIRDWLTLGAPGPRAEEPIRAAVDHNHAQVRAWESFLNGGTDREKLVARYLYEHLFYAHLYFKSDTSSPPKFYRLVRSRTAAPERPDEIATRLPTASPGSSEFYYRLLPFDRTIVSKAHLPFQLSAERLGRIEKKFLADDWSLEKLPGYESKQAANPFVTFAAIPAKARYEFLLDDAGFIVETFMKGPVCRGQVALNVINDYFFIFFLSPDSDPSVNEEEYLPLTAPKLITPFRNEDNFSDTEGSKFWRLFELPGRAISQLRHSFYPYFKSRELKYLADRDRFTNPLGLDDIWDGEGSNENAVLTVFRHFDSASVTRGAIGGMPKTAMVMDYPIFERMYYNLVANFDIYGDIKLQLATRLYMDDLRIEAEDLFLSFLPVDQRIKYRNFWYRGAEDTINSDDYPFYGTNKGEIRVSMVDFQGVNISPQGLMKLILDSRITHVKKDKLNSVSFGENFTSTIGPITDQRSLEQELAKIGGRRGEYLQNLPPASVVRFASAGGSSTDGYVFTFLHSQAHLNVKYLFDEKSREAPAEDVLIVIPGFQGSYPNFYFDVPIEKAQTFLNQLVRSRVGDSSFPELVDQFGVRRLASNFWEYSDWFNDRLIKAEPVSGGLLDLGRYENF